MQIKHFFDKDTATLTYVVSDPQTNKCAIIDPVLNYEPHGGSISQASIQEVLAYVSEHKLEVQWLLETHAHADHMTGAYVLREKLGAKVGIGARIREVLEYWVPVFNTEKDTPSDGTQFDYLFQDGEEFLIGSIEVKVMQTPGHTPACVSYYMQDALFVGDVLFMPYVGTGRCDFPGGSAETSYASIQKIYALPEQTRIFVGHDYPPAGSEPKCQTTVAEEKKNNKMLSADTSKAAYIEARTGRDAGLMVPKLLLPALQINLRAGSLGLPEENGAQYLKIPLS